MKKTIKYLCMGLFLLIPFQIKAMSVSLSLSCPSRVNPGETISCTINAANSNDIGGIQGHFTTSGLTINSFAFSSQAQTLAPMYSGTDMFALFSMNAMPVSMELGTLSVTVPITAAPLSTYTLGITNVEIVDIHDVSGTASDATATITIKSVDNTLSNLEVSGDQSLEFSPNLTEYNLTIDADSVTISATATDANAKVDGAGKKDLAYGLNTFTITVTSESGATKTYTIKITRPDNRTEQGGSGEDTGSTGGNNTGGNTGSSGSTSQQKPATNKKSSNNNLSSLKVNNKEITLTKDDTTYELTVENTITELNITYKTEDSKATVKIEGNKDLKVGENTIKIIVTSEDGKTKTYTLKVTRAKENQKVSSNNYLASLTIENYVIDFDKRTSEYSIDIKSEKELNINAIPEDSKSTVKITDNKELKNGSLVKILVTAEDGSTRTYTITIHKGNNLFIPIIILCIAILIVTLVIVYINKKKKNK